MRGLVNHALPNALPAVITVIGLQAGFQLSGAVLTETVFSWPGIGQYITNALFNSDMNAVIGGTIVVGTCFVGINMLSDLLYKLVDNPVSAVIDGNFIGILVWGILLGIFLHHAADSTRQLLADAADAVSSF